MPKAALTGTIGSGKSAAAAIFNKLGAHIIDADVIAREVVEVGSEGLKKIVETFGEEFQLTNGGLNRKKMGMLIFSDPSSRAKLESIVHPLIRKRFLQYLDQYEKAFSNDPSKLLIYVVPLYFESNNSYSELEKVICVSAKPETCIDRITNRDGITQEQALARLSTQLPISAKEAKSDFVINNDGTLEELEDQVKKVYSILTTSTERPLK